MANRRTTDGSRGGVFGQDTSVSLEHLLGERGPQGPQGERGPQGDQGPVGPAGPQGSMGDSGMGVTRYFADSPTGGDISTTRGATQRYFLDVFHVAGETPTAPTTGFSLLIGEDGAMGPQGDPGPAGMDGMDGAPGTDGTDGMDGRGIAEVVDQRVTGGNLLTGNYTDGTRAFRITVNDGVQGSTGDPGADGQGWTGGSYNAATGTVTFASNDGLGFTTGDLRGADGADGMDGRDGTDGTPLRVEDAPTGQTPMDVSVAATIGGEEYFIDARQFTIRALAMADVNHSFNIADTIPSSVAFTFNASGGLAPYTYTAAGDGTISGNVLTVPTSSTNVNVNNPTTTPVSISQATATDSQTPAESVTADATYTVVDNREFHFGGTVTISRFTSQTNWTGTFTYVNLPGVTPTVTPTYDNAVVTRNSVVIPYASFNPDIVNIVQARVEEGRPGVAAKTFPLAAQTVHLYTPYFFSSGTVPTAAAGVLAGTEINPVAVGTEFTFTNAASGHNWIASTRNTTTFDVFVGGSFMALDGVPTPVMINTTDVTGATVPYYIYNLGGVGTAGSQLRARIRSL